GPETEEGVKPEITTAIRRHPAHGFTSIALRGSLVSGNQDGRAIKAVAELQLKLGCEERPRADAASGIRGRRTHLERLARWRESGCLTFMHRDRCRRPPGRPAIVPSSASRGPRW